MPLADPLFSLVFRVVPQGEDPYWPWLEVEVTSLDASVPSEVLVFRRNPANWPGTPDSPIDVFQAVATAAHLTYIGTTPDTNNVFYRRASARFALAGADEVELYRARIHGRLERLVAELRAGETALADETVTV